MQYKATPVALCSGFGSGSKPDRVVFDSSLSANGRCDFIYPPPCVRPLLCGVNAAALPLASANPPGFSRIRWGDPGPVGACRWVTAPSVSVSRMMVPARPTVCLGGRQLQETEPTGIACGAVCQSRFPATTTHRQFLTSGVLQSLKHHTTCIYLSFHFHRLCVPYTHY